MAFTLTVICPGQPPIPPAHSMNNRNPDPYKHGKLIFNKKQRQFNEERTVFSTNDAETTGHPHGQKTGSPGSSDGKESACNAGDPSPIPGSKR